MPPRVPFIAPDLPSPDDIADDYRLICESNRFTNFGPYEQRFGATLGEYVGAQAVTFSSATTGLQAAVLALFGPGGSGRHVLLPSFTFAAAAQVVTTLGFRPLFVDIELAGLHADPDAAAELVGRRRDDIAGIMFANAFGVGAHHVARWEELARRHDLPLVIDSAAGFGSRYEDGHPIGARGDCEVFSFHATKPLAIGEGGAVLTRDPQLADTLRRISNFGFDASGVATLPGINGKLPELAAAIGLRQLPRLDAIVQHRQSVLAAYRAAMPDVRFARNAERSSLAFVTTVLPAGTDRDSIRRELDGRGIEARAYYAPAVHHSARFDTGCATDLPRTEDIEWRTLALPCHGRVTPDVVAETADVVATAIARSS